MSMIAGSKHCTKSELDLFAVPLTNTSIEEGGWAEYYPTSSGENGPLVFEIKDTDHDYIHLGKTTLQLSLEFVNWDTTALKFKKEDNSTELVTTWGPINNFASTIFNQIEVSLGGVNIEPQNTNYAYKALVSDLINGGIEAKQSLMQCAMFFKDTAGQMNSTETDLTKADVNKGLAKRKELVVSSSGTVEVLTRIHSDLFNTDRYLINGVPMIIKLYRQTKSEFLLMSNNKACPVTVKLKSATLLLRKAKISPDILLAHSKALQMACVKYPIRRGHFNTFIMNMGITKYRTPNLSLTVLPIRIIMCMMEQESFTGSFSKNPFNFHHFGLISATLTLNSQNIPYYQGIKTNFDNGSFLRAYNTLFEGIDKPEVGIDISRSEYDKGYTFISFDLTPDLCSSDHFNLLKTGNLVLDLDFKNPLEKVTILGLYMEYENMLEINAQRAVFADFKTV